MLSGINIWIGVQSLNCLVVKITLSRRQMASITSVLFTQDSIHENAYSLQFWGSLLHEWKKNGRKGERSTTEVQLRWGRGFLWAAYMSTTGLSQSLQMPAYWTTCSCYVPILPKWSTRPLLGVIVTFSSLQSSHSPQFVCSLFFAIGKNVFASFQRQRVPKMFSLRHKHVA